MSAQRHVKWPHCIRKINHHNRRLCIMKFLPVILLIALLLFAASCKKGKNIACPELISPKIYATFHSGDTIAILVYLPRDVQSNANDAFVEVSGYPISYTHPVFDTLIYPSYGTNYYGSANLVLSNSGNTTDTFYVATGTGNVSGGIYCQGIPIYVQP
jgi:hypothetical protein